MTSNTVTPFSENLNVTLIVAGGRPQASLTSYAHVVIIIIIIIIIQLL